MGDESEDHHRGDHRGAARGDQRQLKSRDRYEADDVGDVDERLQHDPRGGRCREKTQEGIGRALSDPHADQEHYHEQPDEHGRADEAQFLTDDREDEVVVGLRQVAPLRVRLPQALAEQPTVGEGVLGLDGLVVQPLRVERRC